MASERPRAPDPGRNVHCLFGLAFDEIDMDATVLHVRRCADERIPCFISTPNVNWVVAAQHDAALRASVWHSDLCLADGRPIVWAARWLGVPIRERVAGADLFERLRRGDGGRPLKVYFFGGADGVAQRAAAVLNAERGGLRCVGHASPGFGSVEDMSDDATIERINASGADFIVVALGAKKGQAWIERNRNRLAPPLISHLGAVVNFVAGSVTRAPWLLRRLGLEWLWRIKEEPALWRRYGSDGVSWLLLLGQVFLPKLLGLRSATRGVAPRIESSGNGSVVQLHLSGTWTCETMAPLRKELARCLAEGNPIEIDLTAVSEADSALVGLLALIDAHQGSPSLVRRGTALAPSVRRAFQLSLLQRML